jgi:hypothetical protein
MRDALALTQVSASEGDSFRTEMTPDTTIYKRG